MLVFIGLIALPLNSLWVIDTGVTGHGINFTRVSLFMNAICVIFVLSLINPLLKRFAAKFSLTSRDMVLIYAMICVSSAIGGHDFIPRLFPIIGYGFYFATPENDWAQLFHRHIPEALVVTDRTVLLGYYKDRQPLYDNKFYIPEYVSVWVVPCLAWSSVIVAVLVCMLGINLLVRKQWTIHEKLAYPLAQIPLDIISNGPRVFKTPLTWVGFSVAVGINVLNGINHFFPNVPGIFARPFLIHPYLTTKPWNTMGWLEINVHLFAVGLAYFMPLDLAFSCWFFYWLWRLEALIGSAFFGVPGSGGVAFSFFSTGRFPYSQEQSIGTCAAILLMAAWGLRPVGRGILDSFSNSFSGQNQKQCRGSSQNQGNGSIADAAEDADLRRYRWASIAILASMCYLIAFCHLAGMSIWVATLFFLILFAVSIVVTRVRIEAGYPMHDFVFRPEDMLVAGFGTRTIGPKKPNPLFLSPFSYLRATEQSTTASTGILQTRR